MQVVPRMNTTTLIAIRFVTVLIALCLTACATGYHVPETPPKLGPDGWPVGVWKNVDGNVIRLNEDGTGSYWHRESGITNTHLIWQNEGARIRVDRWVTTPSEAILTRGFKKRAPDRAEREVKEFYAAIQHRDWWVFDYAYEGQEKLIGTYFHPYRYFWWDGVGHVYKIMDKEVKASRVKYKLIEVTSSQYLARKKREREEELALQRRKEQVELERKKAPSELILEGQFSDDSSVIPNKALDAGETSLGLSHHYEPGQGHSRLCQVES